MLYKKENFVFFFSIYNNDATNDISSNKFDTEKKSILSKNV